MDDLTIAQENSHSAAEYNFGSSQPGLPSPPSSSPTAIRTSSKIKKPPPITPKRFTRFFTPRNGSSGSGRSLERALREISTNTPGTKYDLTGSRPSKRRRTCSVAAPISPSSCASSPSSHFASSPPACPSSPLQRKTKYLCYDAPLPRIQRARIPAPVSHQHTDMADFCSGPEDIQSFRQKGIPFSVTACRTNSLIAVGTDQGEVNIIDSKKTATPHTRDIYLSMRPHENAVTDLDFSYNDRLLATASGDQTARIFDMFTQDCLYVLPEHTSTIKRISFAPNIDSVIATCSRDGVVGIWDLRYRLREPVWRAVVEPRGRVATRGVSMIKAIPGAHPASLGKSANRASLSITSLQFLHSAGREHLFMTSCEGNSQIRLWDIRNRGPLGNGAAATPVAVSREIGAHRSTKKSWGVLSLAVSGDASRVYSVCRDSVVYAYSTNHLILGQAPELDVPGGPRWSRDRLAGAGPLYGMTHASFRPNSFWIRSALRPLRIDQQELLAVGNTDHSPILFPTDEACFHANGAARHNDPILGRPTGWRTRDMLPADSNLVVEHGCNPLFPIYKIGTSLVRGHAKEVTVPCWTQDGDLVTISDDPSARIWRQDPERARSLRTEGEHDGRRWMCGWAEADPAYDEEDG